MFLVNLNFVWSQVITTSTTQKKGLKSLQGSPQRLFQCSYNTQCRTKQIKKSKKYVFFQLQISLHHFLENKIWLYKMFIWFLPHDVHDGLKHDMYQITYLDLPKGAKWLHYGVSIHHPLGFNSHPLEDAGRSWCFVLGHLQVLFSLLIQSSLQLQDSEKISGESSLWVACLDSLLNI